MTVTIAILAKNNETTLPLFLKCLLKQTYPKSQIHLYVRTNDNKDQTESLLRGFVDEHGKKYASVFFDASSVDREVAQYKNHEWNPHRFSVLGKIRQDSISHAIEKGSDYFVCDCDCFLTPPTIETLASRKVPVVAPMLLSNGMYSNFHSRIDKDGYWAPDPWYKLYYLRKAQGLIEVPVVHCTYFIRSDVLPSIQYNDGSPRHEYVIFSDVLRKKGIPQYLDNEHDYGIVTFWTSAEEVKKQRLEWNYKPFMEAYA